MRIAGCVGFRAIGISLHSEMARGKTPTVEVVGCLMWPDGGKAPEHGARIASAGVIVARQWQ